MALPPGATGSAVTGPQINMAFRACKVGFSQQEPKYVGFRIIFGRNYPPRASLVIVCGSSTIEILHGCCVHPSQHAANQYVKEVASLALTSHAAMVVIARRQARNVCKRLRSRG
jgi:hypothetical protein